jgi:hypothetical protein
VLNSEYIVLGRRYFMYTMITGEQKWELAVIVSSPPSVISIRSLDSLRVVVDRSAKIKKDKLLVR